MSNYTGLVVYVGLASSDGEVFSEVRHWPLRSGFSVVIDRKSRFHTPDTIRSRATSLAFLLEFPYVDDRRWRCAADRLEKCKCPVCQGAEDIPEIPDPELMRVVDKLTRRLEPWTQHETP